MQPVSGGYLLCSDSLESSAVSSVGSSQPSLGPAPPLLAALYTGTAGIMPCAQACASHYSTLTTSHVTLRTCAMTERQLNFNREQKNLCKSIKVTSQNGKKTFANWRCGISRAVPLPPHKGLHSMTWVPSSKLPVPRPFLSTFRSFPKRSIFIYTGRGIS